AAAASAGCAAAAGPVMGGEHSLQSRIGAQRVVAFLDTPAVGVVEGGVRDRGAPRRHHLLLLVGSRHLPIGVISAAEGLVDRHDALLRNAVLFGGVDRGGDAAVVGIRYARSN